MPLVLEKRCSKDTHRIELHRDGTIKLLDHDIDMLRAFTAFGAEKPRCLKVVEEWEGNPLWVITRPKVLTPHQIGLIATAWAAQIAPIAWEDPFEDDEVRDVGRERIEEILAWLTDFWKTLPEDAPFSWDNPIHTLMRAKLRELSAIASTQSGPPKEVLDAIKQALEANAYAYRMTGYDASDTNWRLATANLLGLAQKAQETISWRVLMTLTERHTDYMRRVEERTENEVRARQLYAAIRIIEEWP